ncbi:unnamed protein product [Brugia timori]|uniref:isopentenyl-diphosphate Delta-isomerase n=1 Tax=Brugia timori TaxID=42155 RepID=A0A0R3QK83_9BILA|nr:unnamed protein product [Brugia timori]
MSSLVKLLKVILTFECIVVFGTVGENCILIHSVKPCFFSLCFCRQKNNLFRPAVLNVQNNYLDEHCIIVDENDKPLRSESKRFCHSAKTCFVETWVTLHRAFSVFLFTENHEMILQKRAVQKLTFPSVWTNACCSHPLWNDDEMCTDENNVGIRRAARRKLNHELGIQSVDIDQMKVMGRFLYKAMHDDNWGEHEIDYVIILRGCNVKQIRPNPEEVEAVAIVSSMEELTEILKSSEASFSPWFNLIVRNNFLQTWWHELDRIMHTAWARANAIFAFVLSVLSALTFCVFVSTVWLPNSAPVTLSASNIRVKNFVDYASEGSRSDVVMADLKIKVDVAPIFNWNVKEIFLFLVAEYSTPKAPLNQIVLWDKILRRGDWSTIHEESITPKYYFMDDGTNLLNHKNVTLVLRWNVVPNAGYLAIAQGEGQYRVEFPSSYYSGRF